MSEAMYGNTMSMGFGEDSWENFVPSLEEEEKLAKKKKAAVVEKHSMERNKKVKFTPRISRSKTDSPYTLEERSFKIGRWKEKMKTRHLNKKNSYACRSEKARSRARVGGRFVPKSELAAVKMESQSALQDPHAPLPGVRVKEEPREV